MSKRTVSAKRARKPKERSKVTGFEKDYKEIHELSRGILKLFAERQSDLENQIKLLTVKKLSDIRSNQVEMDVMKANMVRANNSVVAAGKYLLADFQPASTRLTELIGQFYATVLRKARNEDEDKDSEGFDPGEFIAVARDMDGLLDFVKQLNMSFSEMETAIYNVQEDMDAINGIAEERVRKLQEEQKRQEEERKKKLEDEKRRKEEALRKKEEEERRKKEAEEMERLKREEEEQRKIEEERKRKEEEELERQRKEEEERQRLEEEERRRQEEEMERKRIEEEERQRRLEEEAREEEARKEEEKRKKLEEERKRQEEEKRRLEEEERKKREDPQYWKNVIVYDADIEEDGVGAGLACIVRVPDSVKLTQMHLMCTIINPAISRYDIGDNEDLVSNIVNLKPADGQPLTFENALWMALPLISGAKNRESTIKIYEFGVESPGWKEVPTRNAIIQQGKVRERVGWLVETQLRHLPSEGINVVVVTNPKTDRRTFGGKGGQLISSVDQRISITVLKHAFKDPSELSLQVVPVDSSILKERYDGCNYLLGTSPVVLMECQHEPQKPLMFSIPNPPGSGKRNRPKTSVNQRQNAFNMRPKSSFARFSENEDFGNTPEDNVDKDVVSILTSDARSRWRARNDISFTLQRDSIMFELANAVKSILLVRTTRTLENQELVKTALNMEESMKDRLVSIFFRRNPFNMNSIHVEFCKRDVTPKRIQSLTDENLSEGPEPSIALIKDGDIIEVSFSGNIHFENKASRLLMYNSNLASPKLTIPIKEVDIFAQNAQENFRGVMRITLLSRSYEPPLKFLSTLNINLNKSDSADSRLLCEFPITLPKPTKEVNRALKIRLPMAAEGPLSEEYFNSLSMALGDEWTLVAQKLKFNPAAIQRITTDHAHLNTTEATQKSARQMLSDWFKRSTMSPTKVNELEMALEASGRSDLVEELKSRNRRHKEETEKKQRREILMKCMKVYLDSQAAVREWMSVGRALGMSDEGLIEIANSRTEGLLAQARTMMFKWIEFRGEQATKEDLIKCLKKLKLKEAVGKVKLVS